MARILITGASRGIGRRTAQEAIARGHAVLATARDPEGLAGLDGLAARVRLDVTDPGSVQAALAVVGEIDVLVSNAGETTNGPVETTPVEEYRRLFELNTLGALRVTQPLVTQFRLRGSGRLIFVSSVLGQIALPLKSPYAASKWALEAIAETLALETERFGVRVSIIEPGPVSGTSGRAAARTFVTDDGPYRSGGSGGLDSAAVSVDAVAVAIVDVIEADQPPLRVPVGDYAVTATARKYEAALGDLLPAARDRG